MTTRSGRAATPCEVSEPAGTEAARVRQLQPDGEVGEGSAPSREEGGWRGAVPEFAVAGGLQMAWA